MKNEGVYPYFGSENVWCILVCFGGETGVFSSARPGSPGATEWSSGRETLWGVRRRERRRRKRRPWRGRSHSVVSLSFAVSRVFVRVVSSSGKPVLTDVSIAPATFYLSFYCLSSTPDVSVRCGVTHSSLTLSRKRPRGRFSPSSEADWTSSLLGLPPLFTIWKVRKRNLSLSHGYVVGKPLFFGSLLSFWPRCGTKRSFFESHPGKRDNFYFVSLLLAYF